MSYFLKEIEMIKKISKETNKMLTPKLKKNDFLIAFIFITQNKILLSKAKQNFKQNK